jgi:dTDP-4-amino-4,6-dideoxygalactose transaminase
LYTILIDDSVCNGLHLLIKELNDNNIDSRIVFHPIHTQPIYKCDLKFPVSENIHRKGISLPSAPEMVASEIESVCNVISSFLKSSEEN